MSNRAKLEATSRTHISSVYTQKISRDPCAGVLLGHDMVNRLSVRMIVLGNRLLPPPISGNKGGRLPSGSPRQTGWRSQRARSRKVLDVGVRGHVQQKLAEIEEIEARAE